MNTTYSIRHIVVCSRTLSRNGNSCIMGNHLNRILIIEKCPSGACTILYTAGKSVPLGRVLFSGISLKQLLICLLNLSVIIACSVTEQL